MALNTSKCSSHLTPLRFKGLIKILFHSTVLSKILSALHAWDGYIFVENESRLNRVLRKAKRYGYIDSVLTFSKLLEQSDEQLFLRVICSDHCVFHCLKTTSLNFTCLFDPEVIPLICLGINRYQHNLTRTSFIYINLYSNK